MIDDFVIINLSLIYISNTFYLFNDILHIEKSNYPLY